MLISLNWLKSFIGITAITRLKNLIPNEKLIKYSQFPINQLTLAGFELEHLVQKKIENKKDIIIEIDTTPNRSDITNIVGFTRELKTLMNFTLRKSIVYKDIDEIPIYLKFSKNKKTQNSNLKYSNSIFLYQISNIEVKESPNWLKYRLLTQNIKPVNNIVDLSNYIMLEWGQPINIYDLTKIKNLLDKTNSKKEYIFGMRKAKMDEKFYAINNICYRLKNEDILITINNFPILIAGIISCKEFFIDYSTTNLLIECSTFSNKKINSISKNLGIRNLSSVLNSKGVSHNITNLAFQHLIKLINLNNYKI